LFSLLIVLSLFYLLQHIDANLYNEIKSTMLENKTKTILFILISSIHTSIVAPIAEEFVFRWGIFTGLLKRIGFYPSMFISAFLFAMIHSPVQYIGTFCFWVMMVYVYYKTRNIFIPIIIHIANNTLSSLVEIYDHIYPTEISTTSLESVSKSETILTISSLVIICAILMTILVKRDFFKINKTDTELDSIKTD
jgi:membrane protease YdiL (CAAX protease family)